VWKEVLAEVVYLMMMKINVELTLYVAVQHTEVWITDSKEKWNQS
jgi:hypothetical protein